VKLLDQLLYQAHSECHDTSEGNIPFQYF